ncbi:class I SAM-dependent DNA methyltransferase [Amycolatopsis sp. NPDC088138]|uniref:class I SAM-dependent DNA methyltransferase n=1 Tax=Amycolatopsis sp. NPDC088138 TaxID=3363938 RepID=UPI0037FE27F7
MSTDDWLADVRTSYDTLAAGYADQVRELLDGRPHLRAALALFADNVRAAGGGPVADVGCGPGYVTAHLHELGVDAFGIDLSPGMIEVARRDHPGLRFEVGSMTDLALPAASVAGLLAWWSLIHIPDHEVPTVFEHFHRALRPGGPLQLGFHVGDGSRSETDHLRQPDQVATWLREAGFDVEAQWLLHPDEKPGAVLFARHKP